MQVISFKETPLFKRGIWLSAAALFVFAAGPPALNGGLWKDPLPPVAALCVLSAFIAYILWKTRVYALADEVVDCDDFLQVRQGGTAEIIAFANVSKVEVATHGGIHRILIVLRERAQIGDRIEFLPQASLWANLAGIERLAGNLNHRANHTRGRPVAG